MLNDLQKMKLFYLPVTPGTAAMRRDGLHRISPSCRSFLHTGGSGARPASAHPAVTQAATRSHGLCCGFLLVMFCRLLVRCLGPGAAGAAGDWARCGTAAYRRITTCRRTLRYRQRSCARDQGASNCQRLEISHEHPSKTADKDRPHPLVRTTNSRENLRFRFEEPLGLGRSCPPLPAALIC
jgi:hypothetical protein